MSENVTVMINENTYVYGGKAGLSRPCMKFYGAAKNNMPLDAKLDETVIDGIIVSDPRVSDGDVISVFYTAVMQGNMLILTSSDYSIE